MINEHKGGKQQRWPASTTEEAHPRLTEAAVQEMIQLTVLEEGEFSLTLGDNVLMTMHLTRWNFYRVEKLANEEGS